MKFLDNTGLSYLWGKIKSFVNNHTTVATCLTVADTSAKVVTINDSSWSLQKGCIIGVKFTNTNTATNVTLNVNKNLYPFIFKRAAITITPNMIILAVILTHIKGNIIWQLTRNMCNFIG